MAVEPKGKEVRVSRRKVLVSSIVAALGCATCAVVAKRAGWTRRIGIFLARRRPKPPRELEFTAPFDTGKPLLETPLENDWVRVDKAFAQAKNIHPKIPDLLKFDFAFRGEITGKGTPEQRLVDPYRIAFTVLIQDGNGKEYTVVDKMVDYTPLIFERTPRGLVVEFGEPSHGGAYELPIRLKDASRIRVRLSKVDS